MFFVFYGKFVSNKEDLVKLDDIYYGGMSSRQDIAESIACEIVNTVKGGTIITSIIETNKPLLKAMDIATKRLTQKEQDMKLSAQILNQNQLMKKNRKKSTAK